MATPFLNLDLPTVSVTLGPAWASQVNAAFEVIDSHDHSSGKGAQIPTAGLNINADLDFNEFAALNLRIASFEQRTTSPSGSDFSTSLSVFGGNLYYTNTSGVPVQITDGGGIVTSAGSAQVFETTDVGADIVISPASSFVYLIVDASAPRSITLPLTISVTAGRINIVKDATEESNTNNITVNTAGSDELDGASSQVLDTNCGSWTIVTDGTDKWFIS